jgi:hypothetical protein
MIVVSICLLHIQTEKLSLLFTSFSKAMVFIMWTYGSYDTFFISLTKCGSHTKTIKVNKSFYDICPFLYLILFSLFSKFIHVYKNIYEYNIYKCIYLWSLNTWCYNMNAFFFFTHFIVHPFPFASLFLHVKIQCQLGPARPYVGFLYGYSIGN